MKIGGFGSIEKHQLKGAFLDELLQSKYGDRDPCTTLGPQNHMTISYNFTMINLIVTDL